jgi:tRNA nucleotidyltransferase (CCA-adding enzyme)
MDTLETLKSSELADKTYIVGGFVRDSIMGIPSEDIDFAVEATKEEFERVFPHASLVGTDFPVYLIKGEEVALTRTEKSTGDKYGDFSVTTGVPIRDDLGRRDFTINSIAKKITTGEIIDPYVGQADIGSKILRTIFDSAFDEDPVRILRAARMTARFDLVIEPETSLKLHESAHKLAHVTKERIVLEFEKMFKQSRKPSIFFRVLEDVGALKHIFPALSKLTTVPAGPGAHHGDDTAFDHTMKAIDRSKDMDVEFHVFMGVLVHDLGKGTTTWVCPKE